MEQKHQLDIGKTDIFRGGIKTRNSSENSFKFGQCKYMRKSIQEWSN